MISDRITPGVDWLNQPTPGSTYASQGKAATARRLRVTAAGDLYLIPPGGTAADDVLFGAVAAGEVIDQFHDGVGASTTATVDTAQF